MSNSISNQKAMLEEFAARQGFTNIVHFTDDGISGITSARIICRMRVRISYTIKPQKKQQTLTRTEKN